MLMRLNGAILIRPVLALAVAFGAVPADAQVNIQPFADFDFDIDPPGARAAGLGGVFVPLADDATAVESNPAGLTNLLHPELSFEIAIIETDRHVPEASGGGPDGSSFISSDVSPVFISGVLPLGRVTFALFRSELVRMGGSNYGRGFGEFDTAAGFTRPVVTPFTNDLHLSVVNWGGGVAAGLFPGVSLGVAGGLAQLDLELDHARYLVQRFDPSFRSAQATIRGDDGRSTGAFFSVGVLARSGEIASFGLVYNVRPRFEDVVIHVGTLTDTSFTFTYNIPDSFTGGMAIRFAELTTLAGEVTLQRYSELTDDFVDFFSTDEKSSDDFRSDDGMDVKAGAEHILFLADVPIALRVGVASRAPSGIYYTGLADGTRALFGTAPENRTTAFTFGIGAAQLFDNLNLDLGVQLAADRRELSTSLIYRFE